MKNIEKRNWNPECLTPFLFSLMAFLSSFFPLLCVHQIKFHSYSCRACWSSSSSSRACVCACVCSHPWRFSLTSSSGASYSYASLLVLEDLLSLLPKVILQVVHLPLARPRKLRRSQHCTKNIDCPDGSANDLSRHLGDSPRRPRRRPRRRPWRPRKRDRRTYTRGWAPQ